MGQRSKILQIDSDEHEALEKAFRSTSDKRYAARCRIILLKSDVKGYSNQQVAHIVGVTPAVVNTWLKRYREQGIAGLKTRPIPGRPGILNIYQDGPTVKEQVKDSRQRLKIAHEQIEQKLGKKFSKYTLRRFLKNLTASTVVLEAGSGSDQTQSCINSVKNSSGCSNNSTE